MNRRRIISVFAAIVFSLSLTTQAFAATSGYYFNGGLKSISNKGVLATIETQNPHVNNGSSVSAWVMTCDSNYTNRYAQVGYLKYYYNSKPYYFYEYNYGGGSTWFQKQLTSSPSTGTHHTYKVGCDNSKMYFVIDGTTYAQVALSKMPFTRNTIEILTETHSVSDQSPGSCSNPLTMGAVKYKNSSDTWYSTTCKSSSGITGMGSLTTQCNNISSSGSSTWEVWDSRY
jgi:hypothetical protein